MDPGFAIIDNIVIGKNRRAVDPKKVALLADSIEKIGLQTPISVWSPDSQTLDLVAGLHRLEACRKLGFEDIDCVFVGLDDLDRQLWEIDENLMRSDLDDLERAQHTTRRAEIVAQKAEIDRAKELSANLANKSEPKRPNKGQVEFVADTATKTGKSKRSVERDKSRGENIADDVQKEIAGTAIADSGVQLDALAAADPEDQREAVKVVNLGGGQGRSRRVAGCRRTRSGTSLQKSLQVVGRGGFGDPRAFRRQLR